MLAATQLAASPLTAPDIGATTDLELWLPVTATTKPRTKQLVLNPQTIEVARNG